MSELQDLAAGERPKEKEDNKIIPPSVELNYL